MQVITMSNTKILFLHGLDSSKESTKFHAINAIKKYCINVDYRNLNYQTVERFYHDIIEKIKPDLLKHRIPTVIANPSLKPDFRDDYPEINEADLEHDIPQIAYIELGDEVLDMYKVFEQLDPYMQIETVEGGHHRLAQPENLNRLIRYMEQTFIY
ncbi:hypothetical protein FQR65_LT16872 [Abscondita terminalis]|nr:hypothetical protein FQR65_LT16872 [Abscondita terminalis]